MENDYDACRHLSPYSIAPIHLLPHPCICAGNDLSRGQLTIVGRRRAVLQSGSIQRAMALPGVLPQRGAAALRRVAPDAPSGPRSDASRPGKQDGRFVILASTRNVVSRTLVTELDS